MASVSTFVSIRRYADNFEAAQTAVIQNLSYFEHLSEPMAELLHILCDSYDYPQLAEEVLKQVTAPLEDLNERANS